VSVRLPAIVLAAGLGTRLDPLTRLVAKPAIPVGHHTLIERVLAWLQDSGVSEVVMNLHHRPETLSGVLGDGAHLGLRLRYSWEDPILGSAGGPARALSLLAADRVLIVNGDTLCPLDLDAMLAVHVQTGAEATLAVVRNPDPVHYNGLVLDEDDRVRARAIRGTVEAKDSWHFVGVQIVESSVFAPVSAIVPSDTIPGLYLDLAAERPSSIRAWRVETPFVDVGTPRDYLETALRMRASIPPTLERSVLWPDARVDPDVRLQDCIVAGPVRLPAGFSAAHSVLMPASVVKPGEHVRIEGDVAIFPL
jgi:NDP-sugar pyrophosphorylase family protein